MIGWERRRERFSTPASWRDEGFQGQRGRRATGEKGGQRTEGMMPSEEKDPSLSGGSVVAEESLQRALEREAVEKLHRENMQLKFEMEAMSGATELSWSEVSHGDGEVKPPPPPPRSRSPTRRCLKIQEEKFTPRGTRVPDTLPAPDVAMSSAVPPWPIDLTEWI